MNIYSEMNSHSNTAQARSLRRRRDSHARVIEAASRLFAQGGFFETSMAAIAEEADVAVGTLYNLFDNKDALYRELTDSKAAQFHHRLSAALRRGRGPLERLDSMLREKLKLFLDEAGFLRFYFAANSAPRFSLRASLPQKAREFYEKGLAATAAVVAEAIDAGLLPRIDPYRAAVALQATSTELFLLHLDNPLRHPAEELISELKTLVFGGNVRPLPGESTPQERGVAKMPVSTAGRTPLKEKNK